MKYLKITILSLTCIILFSCASGTALVTGTKRAAINVDLVTVYYKAPANYEVIGIIKASSAAGWTDQAALDYAMEELKAQAAKVGANGVLFETTGEATRSGAGVVTGNVFLAGAGKPTQMVSGKAILVTK